ncbi:MAG TPA: response regulator transcription factor [Bacillota bacterium]|nr:response regulator transcription factor [Bacillota bacterium]
MSQLTPHANPIRLVIAVANPDMRAGLKELLELDPLIRVAGGASNGFEALKLCDELAPDLVLLDVIMPVCDGVIGTRLIKGSCPTIKVLLIIEMGNEPKNKYALQSGADGYLQLPVEGPKLRTVIKEMITGVAHLDGETFIP